MRAEGQKHNKGRCFIQFETIEEAESVIIFSNKLKFNKAVTMVNEKVNLNGKTLKAVQGI